MRSWIESFRQHGVHTVARDTALTKTKSQKARARASARSVPRNPRLSGSGAYSMKDIKNALKPVLKEALHSGGSALGTMAGGAQGGVFGRQMAGRLSKIIGSGDYETNTSTNDLFRPPGGLASATFGNDPDITRVRRREFLGDILAPSVPGTFTNYTYPINAGLRTTFPFLSQMAENYEEYCLDGLVFEYVSSASPFISNSALGTVIAAMEYNSAGLPFATKFAMENSAHAVSTRLDKNLMYGVECAKGANAQNCYYVRSGESTLPITTTDLGLFQLAIAPASTIPAGSVLGELWVTYDVCMKRPKLNVNRYALYHRVGGAASAAIPLGTATVVETNLGASNFSVASSGTNLVYADCVPGDVWLMSYYFQGTVNTAAATTFPGILTVSPSVGVSGLNALNNDTASFTAGGRVAAGTYIAGVNTILVNFCFVTTQASGVIAFDLTGTNFPTGSILVETFISYVGNGLTAAGF